MQIIKINRDLDVVCESQATRTGFRHTARLMVCGKELEMVKVCYQNRTWERYQFETVLRKLFSDTKLLNNDEKVVFKSIIEN